MNLPLVFRRIVLFGAPLSLGILDIFHPVIGPAGIMGTIAPQVNVWLTVHIIQLPLLGLLGLAMRMLTDGLSDWAAIISRISLWFYMVFYLAIDTMVGIASGLIIRAGKDLPPEQMEGVKHSADALFYDPFLGPNGTYAILPNMGGYAWVISVITAGMALNNADRISWVPLAFLLPAALLFGHDHAPPTGPLGMLCFLIAVLWIEFAPKKQVKQ